MYIFLDRPVESLGNSGRFLLWAMRGWVAAAASGHCPPQALHRGFAGVRALSALPPFHIAMALMNGDALEPMTLARIGCQQIAEDEAILLRLWCDAANASPRINATLAMLLAPEGIGPMIAAMAETAASLANAGFDLADISSTSAPSQESQHK